MKLKAVSGIMLTLLLIAMLTLAFNIQPVKASGTIYIRADGSIEPSTANITSADTVTYYFTDNICGEIVVERDNIVVDGDGYTLLGWDELEGAYMNFGIYLPGRSNVTIKNIEFIKNRGGGAIYLEGSSNNIISGNNLRLTRGIDLMGYNNTNNIISGNNITYSDGIGVGGSNNTFSGNNITNCWGIGVGGSNNTISGNNITNCRQAGIYLLSTNNTIYGNTLTNNDYIGIWVRDLNNTISGNNITENNASGIALYESSSHNTIAGNDIIRNNQGGIWFDSSSNNTICHNNFVGTTSQAYSENSTNVWDDGYPSGGNYWSDYTGSDFYCGPYQNETGSDGIGDAPYIVDENNQDNCPLMGPFREFSVYLEGVTHHVDVVSDSTLSDFNFSQLDKLVHFNIAGPEDTSGFCRATVPKILLGGPYTVLIDNLPPTTLTETSGEMHAFLCFTYNQTTKNVTIVGTRVGVITGDVNLDEIVDVFDVVIAGKAFASYPEHPRWNAFADMNGDKIIDIFDLILIVRNFGKAA